MKVVAKIGTSSITDEQGIIDAGAIAKFCGEVGDLRAEGHQVVVVTSGAIAAGLPSLSLEERPRDAVTLQAASAVGQSRLMQVYDSAFADRDLVAGQVLLAPLDFIIRQQYLIALHNQPDWRQTGTATRSVNAVTGIRFEQRPMRSADQV